jgi:NAD(P)-dependent dehydrogenase (short-subunit alcohol dehydrogenase family)
MPIADVSAQPLTSLLDLNGRVAVVTGGAKGIGAATVRRLAEAGATVVAADLDGPGAEATAQEVASATGAKVVGRVCDVTDTASLAALADGAVADHGGLHIWVNNAGIYPTTGPAIDVADSFIDRMLEVNVRGTYAGAREAAKRMADGGVIVNLASVAGFRAAPGISAYVASKHAVVGVTKALAVEFGPLGIRVLGIAPTVTDTPGLADAIGPLKQAGLDIQATLGNNPLGRVAVADDIARVILFCASDLSLFMTGSTLKVDAGSLAR